MPVLEGKTAVVTGGSRGIGRAIVTRLARDGATVLFSYHSREDLAKQVVAEVEADGGQAYAVQADVGSVPEIVRLFEQADELLGGLDILVNNAAQASKTLIADTTEQEYDQFMALNAKSVFFAIQQAALRLRDGGRIINFSTVNTVRPAPGVGVYAGSKGAVEQFTQVASRELAARQITVNTVSPGATDTDMLRSKNPKEVLDLVVSMTPLARLGLPADVADVVAFLAGPDSRWLTGQNLLVSGGLG